MTPSSTGPPEPSGECDPLHAAAPAAAGFARDALRVDLRDERWRQPASHRKSFARYLTCLHSELVLQCSVSAVLFPSEAVMFRVASALLTIALILACPFHCMANAGGPAASSEQKSACTCCSRESRGEIPGDPLAPDEDCGRGSCLCHGAVVEAGGAPIDLELAGKQFFAGVLPSEAACFRFAIPSRPDWFSDRPSSPYTGRSVRVLCQSFLL